MADPNLTELVTNTLRARRKEFADNVTNKNALLKYMRDNNKITKEPGGREIVREISYDGNGTFEYYTGAEVANVNPSKVISAATYDWRLARVHVEITGEEKMKNSGNDYAIASLIEQRIKNGQMTMANNISTGIYSDGTGSGGKQIDGLQALVADDPTTGTVGGINGATYSWWRNYSFDATTDGGAAASASNIISYMNEVFNNISRGVETPDVIVADNNYFVFFENALQANQRFMSAGEATGGFLGYRYKSAAVISDNGSGIPTNHMYFLNTDYIDFTIHDERDFAVGEGKDPLNQDATVVPIYFMGNLTCSSRERQGVLKD